MKRLVLVRHAKAENTKYDSSDFKRNLSNTGKEDAKKIAKEIKLVPELIISSSANRAFQTSIIFAKELDYNPKSIIKQEFLYDPYNSQEFLEMLEKTSGDKDCVFIFGHNPSIEYLAFNLLEDFYFSVPTCTVIGIEFDINSWNKIEARSGKLIEYKNPKTN